PVGALRAMPGAYTRKPRSAWWQNRGFEPVSFRTLTAIVSCSNAKAACPVCLPGTDEHGTTATKTAVQRVGQCFSRQSCTQLRLPAGKEYVRFGRCQGGDGSEGASRGGSRV